MRRAVIDRDWNTWERTLELEWARLGSPPTIWIDGSGHVHAAQLDRSVAAQMIEMREHGEDPIWIVPYRTGAAEPKGTVAMSQVVSQSSELYRSARVTPILFPLAGAPRGVERFAGAELGEWWGLFGADTSSAAHRESARRLVAALRPERFPEYRRLEHHYLCGISECEATAAVRGSGAAGDSEVRRAAIVVVCGIDGAGKSTHVELLRSYFEASGHSVRAHKMYRHGLFHDTVTDLARDARDGSDLHVWRYERLIKIVDSLKYLAAHAHPDFSRNDVVLFDRYIYTHFAASTGRLLSSPDADDLLQVYPQPDLVVLLDLPAEDALQRLGGRTSKTIDENVVMLRRFRDALLAMAKSERFVVLDAREPTEKNQATIRELAAAAVRRREGGRP